VSKGRRDRVNPWTYVFLVALLVPFLFPLGWMLLSSLKTQVQNTAYPPVWLFTPTLANYREVFQKNPFFTFTVNSLVVALGSTGLALLFGLPGAYAIARFKRTGIALGILTGVGGFFDVGNLATSGQAGASFRFQLIWALLLATVLVILLVEMSGRFAAVTKKALPDAIREHFGFGAWVVPFVVLTLVHFLVLATEIGGICFALHLVSGLPTAVWALPVGAAVWLFLWRAKFNTIENSTSLLGLLTATDILGERGFQVSIERHTKRDDLNVADLMTPAAEVEVLALADVAGARVGHVLETLRRSGRQHALVVEHDVIPARGPLDKPLRRAMVRGIFSLSQIARQLGVAVQTSGEVARTFAEIESALGR